MKKTAFLLYLAAITCAYANADVSLKDTLKWANPSLEGRVFYFDRSFDKPNTSNSTALTVGGIAKVESPVFYGAKVGAAYYGSYSLGVTDRKDGVSSGLLEQANANNISFLGELYYDQTVGKNSFRVGRQRLSTPLANDHDLRLLPSSFEAAVFKSSEIDKNAIEIGYIKRYTGFVSKYNGFKDETHIWGKRGLGYLYLQNKNIPDTLVRAQYALALDDEKITVQDYLYADATYTLNAPIKIALKAQYGANGYRNGEDSLMYGFGAEALLGYADIAAVYNKIANNNFKAIESGAMYTDWQQGYANYEPSRALGGYVTLKPISSFSLKVGKVWVDALESSKRDDFAETNVDFWYTIDKKSKIRVRFSNKDQAAGSNLEDRDDFRAVYYFGL